MITNYTRRYTWSTTHTATKYFNIICFGPGSLNIYKWKLSISILYAKYSSIMNCNTPSKSPHELIHMDIHVQIYLSSLFILGMLFWQTPAHTLYFKFLEISVWNFELLQVSNYYYGYKYKLFKVGNVKPRFHKKLLKIVTGARKNGKQYFS